MNEQKIQQTIKALEAVILSLKREVSDKPRAGGGREPYEVIGEPTAGKNDGEHVCEECGSPELKHWQSLCYWCYRKSQYGRR